MVVSGVFRRRRPVLAAAEVAATAAATTAIAAGHDAAHQEDRLARGRRDHEVRVDILLAKLLRDVQTERAVVVVDVPLCQVAEYRVGAVHFFELIRGIWVVRVLVWVVFEGQLPVRLLDVVGCGRLGQTQRVVQRIAGCG